MSRVLSFVTAGVVVISGLSATAAASPAAAAPAAMPTAVGTIGVNDYPNKSAGRGTSPRGFAYRNCTDFVAWRVGVTWGSMRFPGGDGNARGWRQGAINSGYRVSSTPVRGAVAWWGSSYGRGYGHLAVVTGVNGNGTVNVEEYNYGVRLGYGTRYGVRAQAYLYIKLPAAAAAPAPPPLRDGEFVSVSGNPAIYRLAGGAPVYVSSWANVGGVQPVRTISQQEFDKLRRVPADGTYITGSAPGTSGHGAVYRIAGGAPVYVSSWNNMGGVASTTVVDLAAIQNAGKGGYWNRLNYRPAEGTYIKGSAPGTAGHGAVYRIAGGAPVYVSSWKNMGGVASATVVDLAAIQNAGNDGYWGHLNYRPADGTYVMGSAPGSPDHGSVFRIAGGAPVYVSSWKNMGGVAPTTVVDLAAIENAGNDGYWNHLNYRPADGTFITGLAPGSPDHGSVFRIAGGAPIYVSSWANVGGQTATTHVDLAAINGAGKKGVWSHLNYFPTDGTLLQAAGTTYRVENGVPVASSGTGIRVDEAAIVNAGEPGSWSHLVSPSMPPYAPVDPARLADTRKSKPLPAGGVLRVKVSGAGGVPSNAVAAALNVTAAKASGDGWLTVFPCTSDAGFTGPTASSVNFRAGQTIPNSVISGIGTGGEVCVYASQSTNVLVDVNGYFGQGADFTSMTPARVADTRQSAVVPEGGVLRVQVAGVAGVPDQVTSAALNVTAAKATDTGWLTVFPCSSDPNDSGPDASHLNFVRGQTIANAVVSGVGEGGEVCVYASKSTNVVVDVGGYFSNAADFTPLTPARVADTRASGVVPAGGVLRVQVAGALEVPGDAAAAALNVTATQANGGGWLTVFPCSENPKDKGPNASNVNFVSGETIPNAVVSGIGTGGEVCVYASQTTHVLVDVGGYFSD